MSNLSDFKIIFVYGYTASSKADWYLNISKKLKRLNIDFTIPDLPGETYPDFFEHEIDIDKIKTLVGKFYPTL